MMWFYLPLITTVLNFSSGGTARHSHGMFNIKLFLQLCPCVLAFVLGYQTTYAELNSLVFLLIFFQLVLSWHMNAATACEFSRQEFISGLQALG
jgi:hypothetical protein